MAVFSSHEDEILIELVSKNAPVFDTRLQAYKDNTVRDNIWEKIGKALNKTTAIDTVFVSARFPIEVYEIRETNDGNRLYINNNNEQYTPDGDTKLSRLLKPYKEDVVDKFAKNLLEKLKVLRKARQKNRIIQPDIYVLNGDLLHNSDTSSNEYNYNYNYDLDGFVDETRNQRFKADDLQNVFYQTYPEKRSKVYKPRSILRTEDRTAPPRHKYLYEKDYDE